MRKSTVTVSLFAVLGLGVLVGRTWAQPEAGEPARAIISIYHAAPGKQLELLKWFAQREAIDREVGAPVTQLYVHLDGDSWDYLAITPQLEPAAQAELDKKVDAASAKKRLTTGFKAGLELRQYVSSHTDTIVRGPTTAQAMVQEAAKK